MLKVFATICGVALALAIAGLAAAYAVVSYYAVDLPDYRSLAAYEPPVVTRIHAGDGRLLAELAVEKRAFVPIEAIPKRVINAFLAAEDKTFYSHPGVDLPGVLRAIVTNIANLGTDRRPVGASTITQQVAKNFLLSSEVSIERKLKEAILAFRIEQTYSKDRILELYLNEIYLGGGSYGIAAAALNYFDKSLDELTIAEAAYLGALPKAPNNYHPIHDLQAATARRNWVIGRMTEDGHITPEEAAAAQAEPLIAREEGEADAVQADYFAEEVRRELLAQFGEDQLYGGGLSVRTTLDPRLQAIAERTLRAGLEAYDRRHGWRGPIARIEPGVDWIGELEALERPAGLFGWQIAAVLAVEADGARIGLMDGTEGWIPLAELEWARPWLEGQLVGGAVRATGDVLAVGDVVAVEAVAENGEGQSYPEGSFGLRQIPAIGGAIVALDPHTGRVLAMSGGWSYATSEFNRATQAMRQPGSAFKPFVYLAALENGYTPSTIILDAPIVIDQGPGLPKWKPENYSNVFYGPSTMRLGIEKSRNLMTVRLAQAVGIDKVAEMAARFGVISNRKPRLAMALGASETTLLRLTTGYAMIVNGGKRIEPALIDRVQDRRGQTVFRNDARPCEGCQAVAWAGQPVPQIPDIREQVIDAGSAYQMVSMLEGVVERGTGIRVSSVGKPLAGKTGTTNESRDAWFIGFAPDLAVGVYAGFDNPHSLGPHEQGASVAAPIFRDFMAAALKGKPAIPFRIPPDIRLVRVDAVTGQRAGPGSDKVILEAFKPGTEPTGQSVVIDGYGAGVPGGAIGTGSTVPSGLGGLY
ncbi:penicillin-binding protein 1A [Virgifigura deserti]|uniref:penicillin-binding protein 1A n=1 Tax=Virgifigura deserti TaxID=2268457 RepID=UPI003CCC218F